ncbi:protein of unknown function [Pseudomonas sp. NFPP10]|uniref:DUF1842 domain-containing protein n=1 Tax=Pseudomonas TaxID=286 RepID=UPI0002E72121|nr:MULTISPECIES: DUF1842 domain-containing protein [Pseudomonas]BCQ60947.1 hypothetical protein PBOI14_26970 [Pseudomonas sp. Boi14]POA82800.1 DUF1842 domain-containing protein [Pseudomonas protegens]PZP04258.1 MAG: DUF1842 domain-containing protein [Pseudomonas protegens]ROM19311.1 hypothetical protein BK643_01080 [Pseudomonas protegens]ROM29237.1 hypothetical protein BK645_09720 [Pseudomonas protegens]
MTIGLFHTRLIVANPVIGGPVLTLDLLVDTPKKRVSGVARVTQSTSPPVQFHADVWGDYSQVKLDPSSEGHIILSLAGNPSGPTSQIAETFHLQGILGLDWASGFASYKYQFQGHWHVVQHAAVSPAPVEQAQTADYASQAGPAAEVRHPLYAVALQQAQASGDLARLKALVAQGEQQLANADSLTQAVQQLQAEISRLEQR